MQEHQRRDYQRLKVSGQWPAASAFREAERKRLRQAGWKRQPAREESWRLMLKTFPPVGDTALPARRDGVAADGEGFFIKFTIDERRGLIRLLQQDGPCADCWQAALAWADEHRHGEMSPGKAGGVLKWILWKVCHEDREGVLKSLAATHTKPPAVFCPDPHPVGGKTG